MNENQKVKVVAGALTVFLLGMGSSWFVFRNPQPQTANIADTRPKMKESRLVLEDRPNKAKRSRPTASRDNRNERSRQVRERYAQRAKPKEKREIKTQREKIKINPKAKGF